MIVNEQATVMLLTEARFKDFIKKDLVDPRTQTETIIAVSADSREDVDAFADKALATGGSAANDPMDMASCTPEASRIPTATSGRSSG